MAKVELDKKQEDWLDMLVRKFGQLGAGRELFKLYIRQKKLTRPQYLACIEHMQGITKEDVSRLFGIEEEL